MPTRDYVLAVARIVPENNIDLLLDAVEHLPTRPMVVIVGSSNYQHPTVKRIEDLQRRGAIYALGHVNDEGLLNELWANAGAYWHGHSVGGTNPSLLQALGAGAPTVALDTPFNREVLAGLTVQLVDADPDALARRLSDILSNQLLADQLRERGKAIVASRYNWAAVCESYRSVLEELAARPLRRGRRSGP
ncbi:MAG: glycosyltransferase [Acidimicrobiales bacterium]